mgnify:CR=1 FL=1
MLTSKNYRAQPMRDIKVKSKSTGREQIYIFHPRYNP